MKDMKDYRKDFQGSRGNKQWVFDLSSMLIGVAVGVFMASVGVKYLGSDQRATGIVETPLVDEEEKKSFEFEFYEILKKR